MPRRVDLHPQPRDYLTEDGTWPDGPLQADAPPEAHLAQAVAQRLRTAQGNQTLREVADRAGTSTRPIFDTLHGNRWGSLPIIARLENALNTNLWGNEHRSVATR